MQIASIASFVPSTGIVNPAQAVILSANYASVAASALGRTAAPTQNRASTLAPIPAPGAVSGAVSGAVLIPVSGAVLSAASTAASGPASGPASSQTSSEVASTAAPGPGASSSGGAAKPNQAQAAADAAALAQEMMVAGYSTIVHGTNYTGVVDSSAGVYTGSVFNLAMAKSTGVSVEAVDTALTMRIDELV
jgi:hypothetical protein